jgi:hypothetical protein
MPANYDKKDESIIPEGPYCYSGDKCPHLSLRTVGEVQLMWCRFLDQGTTGDLTDQEFQQLKNFHKASDDEDIWGLYPLDLLWDHVKECGINDEY